jgi:myo-inositol-1(or 4)-monophosphatase
MRAGQEQQMRGDDLHQRHIAAAALANEAAALASSYFQDRARMGTKMKGFQDFVTEADGAVEDLLRRRIAETFPADGFLGEEGGGSNSDNLWIVDPIDGTANFARGEPHWAVSIGFVRQGVPEIGVLAMPTLNELFAARRGHGATRNGEPIRVSGIDDMRTAAVEIGWSARRSTASYIGLVAKVMEMGATVKRSASGALGMAWAACGRVDAYLELHINSWDVAAGIVLAREAGAVVNDFFRDDWLDDGNPILVATPALADTLADAMALERRQLLRPDER